MVTINKKQQEIIDNYKAWEINTTQAKSLLWTDQENLAVNQEWVDKIDPEFTWPTPDVTDKEAQESAQVVSPELTKVEWTESPVFETPTGELSTWVTPLDKEKITWGWKVVKTEDWGFTIKKEDEVISEEAQKIQKLQTEQLEQQVEEAKMSEEEKAAKNSGFAYFKDANWKIEYQPTSLDELLDIKSTIPWAKFNNNSLASLQAQSAYKTFNKYVWATTDSYYNGLKNWEIAIEWENWNRLVRLNGWEPTIQMLEARKQWEDENKLLNVNNTINIANWGEIQSTLTDFQTELNKFDKAFIDKMNIYFGDITAAYNEFKAWNNELNELNNQATSISNKIDEYNTEKRRVLDNIRKRHPTMPLSQQLTKADKELDAIDDEIFVEQRNLNAVMSELKFKQSQANTEFEFNTKIAEQKAKFMQDMYNVWRNDIIRLQDIERQDQLLADEIKRNEKAAKDAIANENKELALKYKYEAALAKYKADLNKSAKDSIINLWGDSYLEYDETKQSWDLKSGKTEAPKTTWVYYSNFTITQNPWDISPNKKDTWYNGWTPWIDFAMPEWTNVVSTIWWEVISVKSAWDYWNQVIIRDSVWNEHMYSHLQEWIVKVWDNINSWDIIAKSWNTGFSTWPHLDYRVKSSDWKWLNPNTFLWWADIDPVAERLARNNAISLFLWETSGKDIEALKNDPAVIKAYNTIENFKQENKDLFNLYNRLVAWDTSKTSDQEQIMKFNNAIAEWAMTWDTQLMTDMIRDSILNNKDIWTQVSSAADVDEQIRVIQWLFSWLDMKTWLSTAASNKIAKTVWEEINEDITSIDQLTGKMLAAYVKSISWVAVSEQEYQRLADQLPQLKDNPDRFERMLENFRATTVKSWTVAARMKLRQSWKQVDDEFFYTLFPEFKIEEETTEEDDLLNKAQNWWSLRQNNSNLQFNYE